MGEYMLRVLNTIDHQAAWSPEQQHKFLKSCETYIGRLMQDGKLKAAQPLAREGVIVSGTDGQWKTSPFAETGEIQVGYYHILAKDLDEAIEIAKGNPEFAFGTSARIEIRPIKTKEESTRYVYPGKAD